MRSIAGRQRLEPSFRMWALALSYHTARGSGAPPPGSPVGARRRGVARSPSSAARAALVREPRTAGGLAECVCLFSLPAHLLSAFWATLERQASDGDGDFAGFADAVARFPAFKQFPAPEGATFELVVRPADGAFDGRGLWGVVNLGQPVPLAWPGLRLLLRPGEGCRPAQGLALDVLPPDGADPDVLLTIRGRPYPT